MAVCVNKIVFYSYFTQIHRVLNMTIVNVHLDGELERFVNEFVRSGYAGSKAEVIRAALREYEQKNQIKIESALAYLKKEMTAGLLTTEPHLKKIWDNPKDDEFWARYK